MSQLRKRMIYELQLQRKSPRTIKAYVKSVAQLAAYYHRSPDKITVDEIRDYVHWLIVKRKLATSSVNQKLVGIRFFYEMVLRRPVDLRIKMKRSGRLPEPLSRKEIARLLEATNNRKHRTLLMTCYGAGVRVSELVHIGLNDILSDRLLILVRGGKGNRDRYTLLSPRLLKELRRYWQDYRPSRWLFEGATPGEPFAVASAQNVFYEAKERAEIRHGHGIHSLRHSFGTHLFESGVDVVTIQRLMGHANLSTTAKYLHVTRKHLGALSSAMDLLRLPKKDELE